MICVYYPGVYVNYERIPYLEKREWGGGMGGMDQVEDKNHKNGQEREGLGIYNGPVNRI